MPGADTRALYHLQETFVASMPWPAGRALLYMAEIFVNPHQTKSQAELAHMLGVGPASARGLTTASPAGAEAFANARASSNTLLDLAEQAEKSGEYALSTALLQKAVEADRRHGQVALDFPSMGLPFQGLGAGYMPGNDAGLIDLDAPLMKSLAKNSLKADPTPYKVSEALHYLGAYTGIREPTEATRTTLLFLRKVSETPAVAPITNNLVKRSHSYARRPRRPTDTGWEIRMKDRKAPFTSAVRKRIEELEGIIAHGGYLRDPDGSRRVNPYTGEPGVWDGKGEERAMNFREFLATALRDTMAMDWFCFRMEPADGALREKFPIVFYSPVDSAQVRRTVWRKYDPTILKGEKVHYVEMAPGYGTQVMREYTWDRLTCMVRNPRVDFYGKGYGYAEIEMALDVIAGLLLGYKSIRSWFDENHIPPGIVNVIGGMESEGSFQVLRQQLSQMGGPNAFWKLLYMFQRGTPTGPQPSVNFVPLRNATGAVNEMEFGLQAATMFYNLVCAVIGMDPEETGMQAYSNRGNALSDGSPESKLENSRDKFFVPTMEAIGSCVQESVIERIDEDFEFGWVNLNADAQELQDRHIQALMVRGFTPNQISDELDEPRVMRPYDPVLYEEVARHFSEDDYDTHEEWREKVNAQYVKECKKRKYLQSWSAAWDAPVGNPSMMTIWAQEQELLMQQLQQRQQMMDQMKMFGIDPKDPDAEMKLAQALQQQQAQMAQMQMGGAPGGPGGPGAGPAGGPPPGTASGAPGGMDPAMMAQMAAAQGGPQGGGPGGSPDGGQEPPPWAGGDDEGAEGNPADEGGFVGREPVEAPQGGEESEEEAPVGAVRNGMDGEPAPGLPQGVAPEDQTEAPDLASSIEGGDFDNPERGEQPEQRPEEEEDEYPGDAEEGDPGASVLDEDRSEVRRQGRMQRRARRA